MPLVSSWRDAFYQTVLRGAYSAPLKESSQQGKLQIWTKSLSAAIVDTCEMNNWRAVAKGHKLGAMPVSREEYLGIDVMAFKKEKKPWLFPKAIFELENSKQSFQIAYSLWKVLNIKADLRMVFCYRKESEAGTKLVKYLANEVVGSLDIRDRSNLEGDTVIVVGYRNNSETFPYGFFKWWRLNNNIGQFEQN